MTAMKIFFVISFLLHGFTLVLVAKLARVAMSQMSINDKFCDTLGLMTEKLTGKKVEYEAYARQKSSNPG